MKLKLTMICVFAALTAGCASPTVVDVQKAGDSGLSCQQIAAEIQEANNFEKKARDERKVTGKNVAAAVLFWPALIGTYSNTGDAIDAAKERKAHLITLSNSKGC